MTASGIKFLSNIGRTAGVMVFYKEEEIIGTLATSYSPVAVKKRFVNSSTSVLKYNLIFRAISYAVKMHAVFSSMILPHYCMQKTHHHVPEQKESKCQQSRCLHRMLHFNVP